MASEDCRAHSSDFMAVDDRREWRHLSRVPWPRSHTAHALVNSGLSYVDMYAIFAWDETHDAGFRRGNFNSWWSWRLV